MTIICWDGRTLAADKRATVAGYAATVTKIMRTPTGELIGASGDLDMARSLMAWYCAGADATTYPDNRNGDYCRAYLIVITLEGKVHKYESEPIALPFEDKFSAMGSGRDYALAAMYLGHNSRKAVEIACALDTGCGNGIDVLRLK
jgi:ATP-dependent protease HslVU (ClpYQ) peptidase subunit